MSGTPNVALDAQRFPIGRFQRQAEFSAEQRQAHIAQIAAQPANLAAAMSGGRCDSSCTTWPTVMPTPTFA